MARMMATKSLGDEYLDRSSEKLLAGVAEYLLRLRIHQFDEAPAIDNHHRVGSRLQQAAKRGVGLRLIRRREQETGRASARFCSQRDHHVRPEAIAAFANPP